MKKNKSNIAVILVIIIAVALISGGIYLLNNQKKVVSENDNTESILFYDFPEEQRLSIKNCKTDTCMIPSTDSYNMLVLNSEYKQLQEKIDKINSDTKIYYEKVNNSTTDNDKCIAVKDTYYHELRVKTDFYNYENNKYVSISVQRNIINLCDNNYERKQVEWYLYDKEENKLLTQEEYKEKELINEQEIDIAIRKIIEQVNQEENLNIDPTQHSDNMILFYDYQGNIIISLYIQELNMYYTGMVRINIEK